ncbi:outer membrane beta-barrel protein [Candidatus Methylobacter oryzae]|uniref:Outer membrane beta-barrel protein n=1 Tax=Candidatus Methylobacter oryzae TaxID=2497749 RepID=A0ABY3CHY9_9GAMM|nr:outer membrane beta-barrel protein [Candidatus Methylobacter oryzae]TRX00890.1 outer membrane beta-barrel protein [Candidatus Methylobacter oryzae]
MSKLGIGWFRDQNGFRYRREDAGYYDVSVGLNWKPKFWLIVRSETRYDWRQA